MVIICEAFKMERLRLVCGWCLKQTYRCNGVKQAKDFLFTSSERYLVEAVLNGDSHINIGIVSKPVGSLMHSIDGYFTSASMLSAIAFNRSMGTEACNFSGSTTAL